MKCIFQESFNNLLSKNRTIIMGCAMIAIMLFHQSFIYGSIIFDIFHIFGHWGVDIFLLISGFGIVNSLQKNSVKQYYKNRANRLLPACLFVGICKTILMQIGFVNFEVYNNNYFLISTNLALWYIYAIIIYYTLAPIIYKLLIKYRYWVLIAVCLFSFIISFVPFGTSEIYLVKRFGWVTERFPAFVLGMYIALLPLEKWNTKRIFWYGWIPMLLCMAMRITALPGHGRIIYIVLLGALPMLCILGSILAQWLRRIRLDHAIEYFGKTSLELYLWHEFIFLNISTNAKLADINVCVKLGCAVLISILISHLTYLLNRRFSQICQIR